jgi:hypothetical protein
MPPTKEMKIMESSNQWNDGRLIMWKSPFPRKRPRSEIGSDKQLLDEFCEGKIFNGEFSSQKRKRIRKSACLLRTYRAQNSMA